MSKEIDLRKRTYNYQIINKDGEVKEKFRLKNTANIEKPKLEKIYGEKLFIEKIHFKND